MGWPALALFTAISVVACTKRNPEICCDSATECTRAGLDPADGLAHCAEGVCVNFACVDSGCDDNGDCLDPTHPTCISGQCHATTCNDGTLTILNSDGSAPMTQVCTLGCAPSGDRCNDLDPSNQLAQYLDMTSTAPDLDLGTAATISTTDGTIVADGNAVVTTSVELTQPDAPKIRVFIVHSLKAIDVTITGSDAFALVSDGDIEVGGNFLANGALSISGPGVFNDTVCRGGPSKTVGEDTPGVSGAGGSGFGSVGGDGGTATVPDGSALGGAAGGVTGTPALIPLRGGCDGGQLVDTPTGSFGGGGGAIQLVSRGRITVTGKIGANGAGGFGGSSGGGILLEASEIDVAGAVVANGSGGASGCLLPGAGENGRLDSAPAAGSTDCFNVVGAAGGAGAAGNQAAHAGNNASSSSSAFAGYGGGGVGRIRINTPTATDFHNTGLFSPNPTTGTLTTR